MTKKITLATIKAFIKKNRKDLYIRCNSAFDGMTDCVERINDAQFVPALEDDSLHSNRMGIQGAWFVFNSRDWFEPFERDGFTGYAVSNCCRSFVLAIPKAA
jgi:hypothetical protein